MNEENIVMDENIILNDENEDINELLYKGRKMEYYMMSEEEIKKERIEELERNIRIRVVIFWSVIIIAIIVVISSIVPNVLCSFYSFNICSTFLENALNGIGFSIVLIFVCGLIAASIWIIYISIIKQIDNHNKEKEELLQLREELKK